MRGQRGQKGRVDQAKVTEREGPKSRVTSEQAVNPAHRCQMCLNQSAVISGRSPSMHGWSFSFITLNYQVGGRTFTTVVAVHPHWPFNEKPAGDFRLQIFYVVMLLSARKQADLDPDHSSFSIFGVVSKCFLFRAHHFIIVLPSLADGSENQVPNVNIYLPQYKLLL